MTDQSSKLNGDTISASSRKWWKLAIAIPAVVAVLFIAQRYGPSSPHSVGGKRALVEGLFSGEVDLTSSAQVPDFLGFLDTAPLKRIKPQAVEIIK